MIAATAIANKLPLYTINPNDFQGIDGLDLRAVAHPDHNATER
jgi:predicted nucleic acid-binding protein